MRADLASFITHFRKRYDLTQEKFAYMLYEGSPKHFDKVDNLSISRWESGSSSPSKKKRRALLRCCQAYAKEPFPGFDDLDANALFHALAKRHEATEAVSTKRYEALIHTLPDALTPVDAFRIVPINDTPGEALSAVYDQVTHMFWDVCPAHRLISKARLSSWMRTPGNINLALFAYETQFRAMGIALQLTDEAYSALIQGKISKWELEAGHFAPKQEGSLCFVLWFALSKEALHLLYAAFMVEILKRKGSVSRIGIVTFTKDGENLAYHLGFKHRNTTTFTIPGVEHAFIQQSYDLKINDFFALPTNVALLLPKSGH